MSTTVFSADVDPTMLDQAEEVLAGNGITLTEAFRQMMTYIVVEKRMPHFECFEPNRETLEAISDAEKGDLVTIGSIADLLSDLNRTTTFKQDYKREKRGQYRETLDADLEQALKLLVAV
jgi:addiction module RelB/DinJ family antitoxin